MTLVEKTYDAGFDNGKRAGLQEAAQICEDITHTGRWAPTKLAVAVSTQKFCAKAIRAQLGPKKDPE